MGRVKQSWQNFAVSLEHGTFFRSADGAVNSGRFIAFYFSESQTSISLNPSNFKAFSEFFRMIDEPFRPKKALVLPFLEPQAQGKSRCRGILSKP
jgi:hypothetical protein